MITRKLTSRWLLAIVSVSLLAFLLLVVAVRTIGPSPNRLEHRVLSDLRLLSSVLERYRDENGQYPPVSEGLEILKSAGYVSSPRFHVDAWGSDLVYKSDDGKVRLYSVGRNRVDEDGFGDDISVDI